MLTFTVYGKPEPQGSTRAFVVKGRPIITSDNKKLKPWRQQVALTAQAVMDGNVYLQDAAPIGVSVAFYFDRPKSVKAAAKTTKPDIDKLLRGILDALTGIVFADDSQVIRCAATKQFDSPARAEISVEVLP